VINLPEDADIKFVLDIYGDQAVVILYRNGSFTALNNKTSEMIDEGKWEHNSSTNEIITTGEDFLGIRGKLIDENHINVLSSEGIMETIRLEFIYPEP